MEEEMGEGEEEEGEGEEEGEEELRGWERNWMDAVVVECPIVICQIFPLSIGWRK